jgi:hypothetical protein
MPADDRIKSIVVMVNQTIEFRRSAPEEKQLRRAKAEMPLKRTKDAIKTLHKDLPILIDNGTKAVRVYEGILDTGVLLWKAKVDLLISLLGAVEKAREAFHWAAPRKRHEVWHESAKLYFSLAEEAWKAAGVSRVGTNPTAPAVKFVGFVLAAQGQEQKDEAISKCLIRDRKQKGTTRKMRLSDFQVP